MPAPTNNPKTQDDKVKFLFIPMAVAAVDDKAAGPGGDGATVDLKLADDGGGITEGYASTFGNVDQGLDRVMPGAFKKTLRESKGKVPILHSHDWYQQIGWNLEGAEDDKGLFVKGWYDVAVNQKAKENYSLHKKALAIGARAGLSMGYRTVKSEPDKDNPAVRLLWEVKLLEYSPVVFPMNEMATITAVKNAMQLGCDPAQVLDAALSGLFAALLENGYSEDDIGKALSSRRAANPPHTEPDLVHSVVEGAKKFNDWLRSLTTPTNP